MKYICRKNSVITRKPNLEHLWTFKNFPAFIGTTKQDKEADILSDMSFCICRDTGIIQLDKLLPLELVYSGYHSEAIGLIWTEHHNEFLKFLSKYPLKNILEIGGGNGRLALEYTRLNNNTKWTIIDPNPVSLHNSRITYIGSFFDDKFHAPGVFDGIVHSHALEHMYDPGDFIKRVSIELQEGDYHIFTFPNLYAYLKQRQTNCLNFEHTIFLTEYFVDYLLSLYGFETIEKSYFRKHSIFYATKKTCNTITFNFISKYDEYKAMFLSYVKSNTEEITRFNRLINEVQCPVFLFGAHVFSQYLINQGIGSKRIHGILDNSTLKQGQRLYGTELSILPPETIVNQNKVAVILKAGAYQEEIRDQLHKINRKVIIFE